MESENDIPVGGSVFDTVTEALDALRSFLTAIGLELSLLDVQLLALAIIVVLLALTVWRIKAKEERRTAKIFSAALLALAAFAILVNWVLLARNPPPDRVVGRVVGEDLKDLRVKLLDFEGLQMPFAAAPVDSVSGEFVINYQYSFGDWPRQIVVSKSDCKDQSVGVTLRRLRVEDEFRINFTCEEL